MHFLPNTTSSTSLGKLYQKREAVVRPALGLHSLRVVVSLPLSSRMNILEHCSSMLAWLNVDLSGFDR